MSVREHAEAVVAYVGDPVTDPVRAFEEAVRIARATSHSRRLDTAVQAALQALVAVAEAQVDLVRVRDREIAELRKRVDCIEAGDEIAMGIPITEQYQSVGPVTTASDVYGPVDP